MSITYVGLDLSYSGAAMVVLQSDIATGVRFARNYLFETEKKSFAHPMARLDCLRDAVHTALYDQIAIDLVCVEGYSMGSKFGREQAGELGGVVRHMLWECGFDYRDVSPSALKQFVTGKGNADKNVMMQQVLKKWGYEAANDNECDAYALARLASQMIQGDGTAAEKAIVAKLLAPPVKKAKRAKA